MSTTDDVLPFETRDTDVTNGIGHVETIVDLDDFTDQDNVTENGRCRRCGYDRGTRVRHTEWGGERVVCRHCEHRILVVHP